MKVTLGGDRLGSGKKQKVEMREYGRSNHDLSRILRTTMSAGTLVPFMHELILPGDTFDINLNVLIKTLPTEGPLFGSYKVQLDLFECPIRLYNAILHNNTLEVGNDMDKVHLPQMELIAKAINPAAPPDDIDNAQINPSCLLSYLGIRGVGYTLTDTTRQFTALKVLSYWDIYKQYYSNKQEKIGAVIHGSATATGTIIGVTISGAPVPENDILGSPIYSDAGMEVIIEYPSLDPAPDPSTVLLYGTIDGWFPITQLTTDWTITSPGFLRSYIRGDYYNYPVISWKPKSATDITEIKPRVAEFPLENLDLMRKAILQNWDETAPYVINDLGLPPYSWLLEDDGGFPNMMNTQEGLGLKTYNSDLFNNWLDSTWVNNINTKSRVSTLSGGFTIDAVIIATKVYKLLNRVAMAGGTYNDWINAVYTHEGFRNCESPMYHGGLIKELIFDEVVSTAPSEGSPLGTLAGQGTMGDKHKGGKVRIRANEPGYIIGIASITPRIDYSQGNKWDSSLKTLNNVHMPEMDEIGFQDLMTGQMAWWDESIVGGNVVRYSAGKQTAWINYQTAVNEVLGNFAIKNSQMFMTLNRRYEANIASPTSKIVDLTTYIDPSKFNFIFADARLDAMNFWAQIGYSLYARRVMSEKVMPNL